MSFEFLYLGNLTKDNVQYEDRYFIKILPSAAKWAINRGERISPTLKNWLHTVEEN